MKIELDLTQDFSPVAVFSMLTNPEFIELRCKASNSKDIGHEVSQDGETTVVKVDRTMPAEDLPDMLKTFTRDGVRLHEVQKWGPAAADGSRTAEIVLHFVGQPMKMRGTTTLSATATGAALSIRAELKATVPLIGGKIEKITAPLVIEAIETEGTCGKEWLASRG
jgi:hypothetical protein